MLSIDGTVRLISDLHLQPDADAVNQRFYRFLDACVADRISALFILGDLFEYWVGDDALIDPFNADICQRLKAIAAAGVQVYLVHGNRDFLLGESMATACGLRILPDSAKVSLCGTATLLLHGDTLCTDDQAYQQFRQVIRSPDWQKTFLAKPLSERLAEVAKLRERSREAMQSKSAEIMDANTSAITAAFSASSCQRMIHGHTHRPGHDTYTVDGVNAERWVLSDWTASRADAIEIDASGIRRLNLIPLSQDSQA